MVLFKAVCWVIIFLTRIRFPPGSSIPTILTVSITYKTILAFMRVLVSGKPPCVISEPNDSLNFLKSGTATEIRSGQMKETGGFNFSPTISIDMLLSKDYQLHPHKYLDSLNIHWFKKIKKGR